MSKYKVQWKYKSSLGGPWEKGDVVEIEDALAERINVDSPGVLKPVAGKGGKAGQNRMETGKQTRIPIQAPITKEDFKAVRD